MKKVAAVLALSLFIGVSAQAGTITFTPLDGTDVFSNPDLGPTSIRFQIGFLDDFSSIGSNFTAIAQHIGVNGGPIVNNGLTGNDFAAFFEFVDLPFTLTAADPSLAFDSAFLINAIDFGPGSPLPFDNVGIVTVEAAGVPLGTFLLDSVGEIGAGSNEAAIGSISFNVVPEPATISLLALGALGLLRRRKTA